MMRTVMITIQSLGFNHTPTDTSVVLENADITFIALDQSLVSITKETLCKNCEEV